MAKQPTVPSHLEDAEEEAPSVSLSKLMDVMTKRLERLLAEQNERSTKLFKKLFDERLQRLDRQEVALTDSDVTGADSVVMVTSISVTVERAKSATRAKKSAKQVKKSVKRLKRAKRAIRTKSAKQAKKSANRVERPKRAMRAKSAKCAKRAKIAKQAKKSANRVKRPKRAMRAKSAKCAKRTKRLTTDECEACKATRCARRGESRADDSLFEPVMTIRNSLPDQCWTTIRDDRTIPARINDNLPRVGLHRRKRPPDYCAP